MDKTKNALSILYISIILHLKNEVKKYEDIEIQYYFISEICKYQQKLYQLMNN